MTLTSSSWREREKDREGERAQETRLMGFFIYTEHFQIESEQLKIFISIYYDIPKELPDILSCRTTFVYMESTKYNFSDVVKMNLVKLERIHRTLDRSETSNWRSCLTHC